MPNRSSIRVLQVITGSDVGGAQLHVELLTQRLPAYGVMVEIACRPGGPLVGRVRASGTPVWFVPQLARGLAPWGDLRALLRMIGLLRRGRYDLVHCHSSKAGAIGRIAAALVGAPCIFTAHGFVFNNDRLPGWQRAGFAAIERILSRLSAAIITVSEADREIAIRAGIPAEKLHVIPNGLPLNAFRRERRQRVAIRGAWGFAAEHRVIGTVTRLVPDKDVFTWLRAAAIVASKEPLARFVIAGDGPQRKRLQNLSRVLGLGDRIRWLGVQDNVLSLLPGMDLFVLSSRKEGMPFAVLEAMAAGVPIVATAVGGVPETVGPCAELVPAGDAAALAEGVCRMLADRDRMARLGAAARSRVRERFDIDHTVAATIRLYRSVLRGRGAGSA